MGDQVPSTEDNSKVHVTLNIDDLNLAISTLARYASVLDSRMVTHYEGGRVMNEFEGREGYKVHTMVSAGGGAILQTTFGHMVDLSTEQAEELATWLLDASDSRRVVSDPDVVDHIDRLEQQNADLGATVRRGAQRIKELEAQRDRLAAQNSALLRALVAVNAEVDK